MRIINRIINSIVNRSKIHKDVKALCLDQSHRICQLNLEKLEADNTIKALLEEIKLLKNEVNDYAEECKNLKDTNKIVLKQYSDLAYNVGVKALKDSREEHAMIQGIKHITTMSESGYVSFKQTVIFRDYLKNNDHEALSKNILNYLKNFSE